MSVAPHERLHVHSPAFSPVVAQHVGPVHSVRDPPPGLHEQKSALLRVQPNCLQKQSPCDWQQRTGNPTVAALHSDTGFTGEWPALQSHCNGRPSPSHAPSLLQATTRTAPETKMHQTARMARSTRLTCALVAAIVFRPQPP